MDRESRFWRVVLLALPLAVFAVLVIWPLASSFWYSFTNWNGFNPDYDFVGFDNFLKIHTDKLFLNAAINTALWMIAAILLPTALGLGLALLIDSRIPGGPVFKSIFYLPICLSAVVVGQIWVWIYQPDWGAAEHRGGGGERREVQLRVAGEAGHRTVVGDRRLVVAADGTVDGDLPGRADHHPRGAAGGVRDRGREPPPNASAWW